MALTSNTAPTTPHRATLLQQIKQVCLTYVTQRYLWLGTAFLALIIVPNIIAQLDSGDLPLEESAALRSAQGLLNTAHIGLEVRIVVRSRVNGCAGTRSAG